jgi:P-type conjugative transfer protein TrbJ
MQLQAQATQNAAADEATLSSLVSQSQSAAGALQASQATNQLLSLIARELMQEQQLRLTQDRAMRPSRRPTRSRRRPAPSSCGNSSSVLASSTRRER